MEGLEVERKAIVDFDQTLAFLKAKYRLVKIQKYDYYFKNSECKEVRVRKENDIIICTTKNRSMVDGYEVNKENEITINSNLKSTIEFYENLGFKEFFRKEKKGYRCETDNLVIELIYVNDIAFLEVEAKSNTIEPQKEIEKFFKKIKVQKFEPLNYYQIFKQ